MDIEILTAGATEMIKFYESVHMVDGVLLGYTRKEVKRANPTAIILEIENGYLTFDTYQEFKEYQEHETSEVKKTIEKRILA